jgi:hypothetical protein
MEGGSPQNEISTCREASLAVQCRDREGEPGKKERIIMRAAGLRFLPVVRGSALSEIARFNRLLGMDGGRSIAPKNPRSSRFKPSFLPGIQRGNSRG